MKNFRIIYLIFSFFAAAVLFNTGCEKVKENDLSGQVVVKLSLDQIFQEKAYVRVRHNGEGDQLWFSFITDDLTSDASELLNSELTANLEFYGQINANSGVNRSVTFSNLVALTDYRVIAAALTLDGEICSNVAVLDFVTKRNPDQFFINENWAIAYDKREASEKDPNVKQELFKITSKDSLTYYPFVVLKKDYNELYGGNIRKCFESYVEFRNHENIRWSKSVMVADTTFRQDRLRADDYFVFMMGIDKEGELSGYYAYQELTLEQEVQLPGYAQWLGKWMVQGTTADNMSKSYEIEIKADENNLYYKMYGWEGDVVNEYYGNISQECPIPLYFEQTTSNAYILSTYLGERGMEALFYIYGNAMIRDSITPINIENMKVAAFKMIGEEAFLTPEQYSVYDDANEYHNDDFFSFGYCYTLRGLEYVGFAPYTADSKVIVLRGIEIQKL